MRTLWRWLTIAAGLLVTAAGLVLMPVPGPGGTPVTLAGLAILSTEFSWARRVRERLVFYLRERTSRRQRILLLIGSVLSWVVSAWLAWFLFIRHR